MSLLTGLGALAVLATGAPLRAQTAHIALSCPDSPVAPGGSFSSAVTIDVGPNPLGAYTLHVAYDPTVVVIDGIAGGTTPEFSFAPLANHASFATGSTAVSAFQSASVESPTGTVDVMRITFKAVTALEASSTIDLVPQIVADTDGQNLRTDTTSCTVTISGSDMPTTMPPDVSACAGDCDGTREVTITELLRGVNIALGTQAVAACPSFDRNGDNAVAVNELIQGVNAALDGCPPPPATPTPTAIPTPTSRPNSAPLVSPPAVYHAVQGHEIRLAAGASDPDGDHVHYAAAELPDGASLDEGTGVLMWTPQDNQIGPFYIPFACIDDGVPPKSTAGVLALQVSAPDACVTSTCDAATGCTTTALPVTRSCCAQPPPERAAYVEAACPDGAVLFAGGNSRYGIGRLQDCDFLRVVNYLQSGATVRLNVEARCLRTDRMVRVRTRLETPSRLLFDHDQPVFLQRRGDGYTDRYGLVLNVLGPGPFFEFEGAEAKLTVTATDVDGTTAQTQRRVILTFGTLADLIDPVASPRPAPGS